MSYILDALRKADAERERGHVPGLHSQPAISAAQPGAPRAQRTPWLVAGALLGVAVLGGAAWWWRAQEPAPPAPRPAGPAAAAPLAATPVAPVAPVASVAPAAPVAPPLPKPQTAAPPNAADGVPAPPRSLFPPAPLPPEPAPAPGAAVAVTNVPTLPAQPPVDRVVAFDKLPADVKRQLPTLSIGGAIYSDSAAQRLLIVGGQLLHEGEAVAPGVVLEQIKPKSAVLRKDQLRYEVGF